MSKRLLIDCIPFEISPILLNEIKSSNPNAPLRVTGILQTANKLNQNGRVYPKKILEREVENYVNNYVKERRSVGELDHPEKSIIELKNVSHLVTEVHWDGDNVVGTVEILTTPAGNILRELIKNNVRVGISSRSLGTVHEGSAGNVVGEDLVLVCWDFVSNPSTKGAFMNPVGLNEGVDPSRIISSKRDMRLQELVRDLIIEIGEK
jgi:hypothetical protein